MEDHCELVFIDYFLLSSIKGSLTDTTDSF